MEQLGRRMGASMFLMSSGECSQVSASGFMFLEPGLYEREGLEQEKIGTNEIDGSLIVWQLEDRTSSYNLSRPAQDVLHPPTSGVIPPKQA